MRLHTLLRRQAVAMKLAVSKPDLSVRCSLQGQETLNWTSQREPCDRRLTAGQLNDHEGRKTLNLSVSVMPHRMTRRRASLSLRCM